MALPMPTEEQIASLPKWARVALAARAAGHLAYRIPRFCSDDLRIIIWRAIREAELSAEYGVSSDNLAAAALAADQAHEALQDDDDVVPAMAAAVACWAAKAAQFAGEVSAGAAFGAASAAHRYGTPADVIGVDYHRLAYLAIRHEWTHDTPVSMAVFSQSITQSAPYSRHPGGDV